MSMVTLDDAIMELKKLKLVHGGGATIAIKDADTSWHMKIHEIRESNNNNGRILIVGSGYGDNCNFER